MKYENLKPIGTKVIINVIERERIADGIIIPPNAFRGFNFSIGNVVAIGKDVPEGFLKVGDLVRFDKYSIYSEELLPIAIVDYYNVIGILQPGEE